MNEMELSIQTNTEKEIWGQPNLWLKIYDQVLAEKQSLVSFLEIALSEQNLNVILTGAGSSAFIGLSLVGSFNRNLKKPAMAISTTDLVTHPSDYFGPHIPVLLISFARSGNSPESVAVVKLADQVCTKVYHLIITCDVLGALAKYNTKSARYNFILPAEANDKSLAMTGSYSGMLLTGLLIARIKEVEKLRVQIDLLQQYANKLLGEAAQFKHIAELDFDRAVFLGSGPLSGTATESHLKVQELTDGKVICKCDSFLGFRHGPKVVINNKTLIFLLFSNQPYVLQYEKDLLAALGTGQEPLYVAGLIETSSAKLNPDKLFVLSENGNKLEEEFLPVCSILPAQMIGFYKSLYLGMDPDMPSASGAISRVVKGVVIYPY
ncbi:MAG: SIS domain-containing protein [Omnitrophica WOR_2 bacterium]